MQREMGQIGAGKWPLCEATISIKWLERAEPIQRAGRIKLEGMFLASLAD